MFSLQILTCVDVLDVLILRGFKHACLLSTALLLQIIFRPKNRLKYPSVFSWTQCYINIFVQQWVPMNRTFLCLNRESNLCLSHILGKQHTTRSSRQLTIRCDINNLKCLGAKDNSQKQYYVQSILTIRLYFLLKE